MGKSPLARIEKEALSGDIVQALRLCATLGRSSSSSALRKWASLELAGYGPEDDLPEYRRINAPLCIDGQTLTHRFVGQEISSFNLPDFARDTITSEVNLPYSIPQLQDMARSARQKNQPITLAHPGAAHLVSYMNMSGDYKGTIHRLYWQVSSVLITGVLDRVRVDLLTLVSEMQSGVDGEQADQSPDLGSEASKKRIATKSASKSPVRRVLEPLAWIATIIGTVVALWQVLG
jgi:hypothetical protein